MQPQISIIIPAYNVEKYIAECLRSVLAQTFFAWEAIVIDDGSTDATVAEVKKFDDERIKLLQQQNAGLSVSRNEGIGLAKGDFVLCLDSDDRLHPQTLQACFELTKEYDLDAITFDGYDFRTQLGEEKVLKGGYFDRSNKLREGVYSGEKFLEEEVFKKVVVVSAPLYLVKREKLLQVPFEKGMLHEDVLFHYQLMPLLKNIYYLPNKFYQRRLRDDSIVHSAPSLRSLLAYQKIIDSLEQTYCGSTPIKRRLYRKIIQKNMLQVGKLGKRYLLGKEEDKKRGKQVLIAILTSSRQLKNPKILYVLLGAFYYFFADLRLGK